MFHHHFILFPFFVLFHMIGVVLLLVGAVVVVKAFRRRRLGFCEGANARAPVNTGNSAFDDYRRATLRKLEAEAEEFRKYLDGLRRAADAASFDAFLKSRRAESGPAH